MMADHPLGPSENPFPLAPEKIFPSAHLFAFFARKGSLPQTTSFHPPPPTRSIT